MKKRIAAVFFVICVLVLLMLAAGFEQSDGLSTAEYLICSALGLGGMYISGTVAGFIQKRNARRTEKCDKRSKENVKLKTLIL